MSCHQSSFTILATWVFFYHFRTRVWLSLHLFVICWLWYFLDFSYFQWKFIFLSLSFEPELFSKRSQIPNVLYNKTSSFYRINLKRLFLINNLLRVVQTCHMKRIRQPVVFNTCIKCTQIEKILSTPFYTANYAGQNYLGFWYCWRMSSTVRAVRL